MTDQPKINPGLKDIMKTALSRADTRPTEPRITVRGDHNVVSWGGNITIGLTAAAPSATRGRASISAG